MNFYADRYAHFIVNRMLRLEEGEKLSLNCNEETLPFAHMVAHVAAEKTGVPVSLVYIENGKVESVDEIDPSYQAGKEKGVAMLHLASFPKSEESEELDARTLQSLRLLADPIFLDRRISVPWATAYVPTPLWAEFVYGQGATTDMLWNDIASLYELEDEDAVDLTSTLERSLAQRAAKLNALKAVSLRLESPTCHLELPLAVRSQAVSSASRLASGRFFYPSFPCEDIAIALDWRKAEGSAETTLPFRFFSRIVENASFTVKGGRLTSLQIEAAGEDINRYLNIDSFSASVGELILCDGLSRSALYKRSLGLPAFDHMRTTTLVFGGVRPEAVTGTDEESLSENGINTGFARLELPVGSPSLNITAADASGKETLIMEDGSFTEEF